MNKSLVTNSISFIVFVVAYFAPEHCLWRSYALQAGLFAFSGAFTNWLAVYMLFEKVPGIYGSGIVPKRFEEFKTSIRELVMNNFFTRENFDKYVTHSIKEQLNLEEILDKLYDELVIMLENSSLGSMLVFFGEKSKNVLASWRKPFKEKVIVFMNDAGVLEKIVGDDAFARLEPQVHAIIQQKLEELTPDKVKEIIQRMIRKHLGWLVVWGGIFGGAIGLFCSLLQLV